MSIVRQQTSIGLGRFIASVLLPLIVGLGLFYLTMNPPMSDFSAMMELMLLTTLLSLVWRAAIVGLVQPLPRLRGRC
jgi:Ca2+/Na+ antiporter